MTWIIGALIIGGAIVLWLRKKEEEPAPPVPPEEEEFECPYCPQTFPTFELLTEHIERDHVEAPEPALHECVHCGAKFATMAELTEHVSKVHGFFCSVCGANFPTKAELDRHLIEAHGYPAPGQAEVLGVKYLGVEWREVPTWPTPRNLPYFKWRVTWRCAIAGDYTIRLEAAKKVYGSGADWHYITGILTTGVKDILGASVGKHTTDIESGISGSGWWPLEEEGWAGTFMVDVGVYIKGQPAPIHSFRPYPELNPWGVPEVHLP